MKAIQTRYLGPTDRRGARIKAYDGDNSVTVSYDHGSSDPHREAAKALCAKLNWHGTLIQGGTKKGEVFVWVQLGTVPNPDTFEV